MTSGRCCRAERPIAQLVLLAALLAGCSGGGSGPAELRIEDAWARPTSGAVGAVYLTVVNGTATLERLRSASSEVADAVELHRTRISGDRMRMEPLPDGLSLDPGATATFAPGGLHVMLIGLHAPLETGTRFELVLNFERAGARVVPVDVRSR